MAYDLTPIEKHGDIYLKRDDLFVVGNVNGGKARTMYDMILKTNPKHIVTVGSRTSVQITIASSLAKHLGIGCTVFVPKGPETLEVKNCIDNGTIVEQITPGHTSVVTYHARTYALEHGFLFIPWGMENEWHVSLLLEQAQNIPSNIKRIVIPVGGGMTAIGVALGRPDLIDRILGVQVGADPHKRFNKWLGRDLATVTSEEAYNKHIDIQIDNITLDPAYEAKCYPYLEPGDLLWISGRRTV